MSLDLFDTAIRDADIEVTRNAAKDLPSEFAENFDVSLRHASEWASSAAYNFAREKAMSTYLDDVKARTGVQLPLYGMGGAVTLDELNAAIAKLPQDPSSPEPSWQPLTEQAVDQMAIRRMAKAHDDNAAMAKREQTWGGFAGSLAGGLIGSFADPVTVITAPLGGAGEAAVWVRALEFAGIAAGTTAAGAVLSLPSRERAVPGSSAEIPGEVASAAVFGAGMGGAFGLLGKILQAGAKKPPTSIADDLNAAGSDAQFNAANVFPGAAGEAANRDAVIETINKIMRGENVVSGERFDASHIASFAEASGAKDGAELAAAANRAQRPLTHDVEPDVEVFDRLPNAMEDAASYWDERLAAASPEERAALGASDAGETITSAAIRYNGRVFEGPLHSDAYETAAAATGREFGDVISGTKPRDTGFVTSTGRFVDREEAARIANGAKQTTHDVDELVGEHLPEGYFRAAREDLPARDLAPEDIAKLAADPQTDEAVQRNLDRLRLENLDREFTMSVRQADGSVQMVTRRLEDVLDEIDGFERAGKELLGCVIGAQAAE